MCGIAAILKRSEVSCPSTVLTRMRDEVAYRGPDDQGTERFANNGPGWRRASDSDLSWQIGLAHRRLSIIDLSTTGHQPMVYRENFWTIYNGEVYNFLELRSELERIGHVFRSTSDTEVILAAYAEWGAECFSRFRGMWAIVILDCLQNQVVLSRDRLGIKPLYLWSGHDIIAIASEIKQFLQVPQFKARLNAPMAAEYLQTGYEDPAHSLFKDVHPIPTGCWLRIPLDTLKVSEAVKYWHPDRITVAVNNAKEASQLFFNKLFESIGIHLRSDVPVGCALSGGLDSSSIAVLMNEMKNGKRDSVHTFTATFPGYQIDELEYADAVNAHMKASPHFVTPDPLQFVEELDRFLWIHDEPVGGLSMYAGYCVARLTHQAGVPVTLNGQGGDEIFSGYWQSYFLYLRELWNHGCYLSVANHFAGALLANGNSALVGQIPIMMRRYHERSRPWVRFRLPELAPENKTNLLKEILALDSQARRVYEIRTMHLPRLLKWDDRNFMAFSVEGRYPLLDHQLIELCLSYAPRLLYKLGWTKYPLRLALDGRLPPKVLHRRSKYGFETPQSNWLCGVLRPNVENWLRQDRPVWDYVERDDVKRVAEQTWRLNGKRKEPGLTLLRIYMFDRWLDIFGLRA